MDFDIRTKDAAWDLAQSLLGMTGEQIIDGYLLDFDRDFEAFWKAHKAYIDTVNIEPLRIMAFHITGSIDDCACYKQNGLLNLQQVVSMDTPVKRMFDKYDLHIDLNSMRMEYKGISFDVDYEHYRYKACFDDDEKAASSVARRLFYDYCADAFLMNDDIYGYGTDIHQRPEFIRDLVKMIPELKEMENEWIGLCKSYRLDFYAHINQIELFTFPFYECGDSSLDEWAGLSDEQKMKKWMLSCAIARSFDELTDMKFLYVKSDLCIPPDQIISYTKIPNSQPKNFM